MHLFRRIVLGDVAQKLVRTLHKRGDGLRRHILGALTDETSRGCAQILDRFGVRHPGGQRQAIRPRLARELHPVDASQDLLRLLGDFGRRGALAAQFLDDRFDQARLRVFEALDQPAVEPYTAHAVSSEERRVGKEGVRTWKSWWTPDY